MGFFKKIGATIKKATKQINFNNAVKLVGNITSSLPGIGGLAGSAILSAQDAHHAKKAQAQANNDANLQMAQVQYQNAQAKLNDNVNTIGQTIAGQAVQSGYAGLNEGVKTGVSNVGAQVTQSVLVTWLKKRWYMVVGALVLVFVVIKLATKKPTYRRR